MCNHSKDKRLVSTFSVVVTIMLTVIASKPRRNVLFNSNNLDCVESEDFAMRYSAKLCSVMV